MRKFLDRDKTNLNNHLLSIIWLLFFIMPNNYVFYIFVPISYIILVNKKNVTYNISRVIIYLVISLVFTLVINVGKDYIVLEEYARIITIMIFLFSFTKIKGTKILKIYIYFAIFFLFFTQLSTLFNLSSITNLIKSYYSSETVIKKMQIYESVQINDFGTVRLGGIYFNSNQYARYLELVLITFLCEVNTFRKKEFYIIIPIIVFSIIATGSRTGLIVLFLIFLYYIYLKTNYRKRAIMIILISLLFGILFLFINGFIGHFRVFQIREGLDNSLSIKIDLLNSYLTQNHDLFTLLFGNLSNEVLTTKYHSYFAGTDFDIGNIIVRYGFVFFFLFIGLCYSLLKKTLPKYKLLYTILFWMFSSSIICNYRTAPIFFLMIGIYYRRSLIESNMCFNHNDMKPKLSVQEEIKL